MATENRTQSQSQIRSSELVVLLGGWRERAQKCRDEARAIRDQELNSEHADRYQTRAQMLDSLARELEIIVQHAKLTHGGESTKDNQ